MKRFLTILFMLIVAFPLSAQVDRREVRSGNRKFGKEKYKEAEIEFRKAALKDSLSVAAEYNLASTLYREEDYENADKAMQSIREVAPAGANASDYHYNAGDIALKKKDYKAAVDAFRAALLLTPGDLDAKENYIYAKKMLENQQGGGGGSDQDQDQDQNQNQDQNQDQNQNQDQDQNQNQNQDQNQDQSQISPQQAQQMLRAIQAKEKETQDKVNKEKAAALQSKQKEKNW